MNRQDDPQFESDAKLAAEVERLESWFSEVATHYPEPECEVLEQVKESVEVVVREQCLAEAVGDASVLGGVKTAPPSAKTLSATKDAVRRELVALSYENPSSKNLSNRNDDRNIPTGNAFKWGSLIAMASAALIAFVILPNRPGADTPKNVVDATAIDDWAYVLTDSESGDSEFESDLSGLQSDLNDFGDSFVSLDDFADELGTDDLEDAIDQLYSDSVSFLDS